MDYLLTSGCDENDDQQLDFREFKLFCRYAKKHAKKKKTVPTLRGVLHMGLRLWPWPGAVLTRLKQPVPWNVPQVLQALLLPAAVRVG